jgi:hypothetical protein
VRPFRVAKDFCRVSPAVGGTTGTVNMINAQRFNRSKVQGMKNVVRPSLSRSKRDQGRTENVAEVFRPPLNNGRLKRFHEWKMVEQTFLSAHNVRERSLA